MRDIIQLLPSAIQRIPVSVKLNYIEYTDIIRYTFNTLATGEIGSKALEDWLFNTDPTRWSNRRALDAARRELSKVVNEMYHLINTTIVDNRLEFAYDYPIDIRTIDTYKQTRVILVITIKE